MTVNVRPATAEDASALAAVAAVTFPLACPPHTTDEAKAQFIATVLSEERFAGYLTDQARDLLIAESEDGTAIGYAMLVNGEPADPDVAGAIRVRPTIELSKCYVLPGHHGEGVAGLLMRASIDAATAREAEGIWLGVNEENARAQHFYGKHGFERVGSKRFLVGDRLEHDWVMERAL
ncbi:GNAT family N-acetyltransferase [Diaminobutyricibacter sp. McL0608]|uniref:GNAT family N-acetyltransferase n=1 Tax=Leifsonia sp. McL0608 TaxID=3143537 RepID=UPI0031F327FB